MYITYEHTHKDVSYRAKISLGDALHINGYKGRVLSSMYGVLGPLHYVCVCVCVCVSAWAIICILLTWNREKAH